MSCFALFIALHIGVRGLDADTVQIANLAGQSRDHILRRINGDGHNVDIARSIGNTHAPDDIAAVLMQQGIEPFHRICVLYHDSHYGNSCLHKNTSE